jgi:hypothetical protein
VRVSSVFARALACALSFLTSSDWDSRDEATRGRPFVPVERSLPPCVRLFAPLRDKVTSSTQSLVPSRPGPPSQGSSLSILTEPHDELAAFVCSEKNIVRGDERAIRGTGVTEHWIGLPHQSALMLRVRMTLPHFSVSSAMNLPKSAGEPAIGVPSKSASLAFSLGAARPALISLLSSSTISAGVFLGALLRAMKALARNH